MISNEMLGKFNRVVKAKLISKDLLNDVACAVCTADMLHGTNEKELDINRFISSLPNIINGVGTVKQKNPLPDVQVLRVLCDTLSICLLTQGAISSDRLELTIPSSTCITGLLGVIKQQNGYLDESECMKVLDSLVKLTSSNDDLDPTISYVIKFMLKYDKSLDCRGIILTPKYRVLGHLNNAKYTAVEDYTSDSFLYELATCLIRNYSKVSLARRLVIAARVDELQYRHRKEVLLALESGTLTVASQGNHSLYSIISKLFHFTYSKTFIKEEGVLCLIYLLSMNPANSSIEFMKDLLLLGEKEV